MRRRSAIILALAASACDQDRAPANVLVAPSLLGPRDLLSSVTAITLSVFDASAGVDCAPATGVVTGATSAPKLATTTLTSTGCAPQYRYCGSLTVDESDGDRIFLAKGANAAGATVATGCARAKVNTATLSLPITMERYVAPATCGDGVVEPTEQCEGVSFSCDSQCHSTEVQLSAGADANGTQTGMSGDKFGASFLWPSASGDDGRFLAFFTDKTSGRNDVGMRVLSDTWTTALMPASLGAGELLLPNGSGPPAVAAPGNQSGARAAFYQGRYYVVFQDDDSNANGVDVHMRSMDASFTADQAIGMALGINGANGAGEDGDQTAPDVSLGPNGRLFVAWQDDAAGGVIRGRLLMPPTTLGDEITLSTGSTNTGVSLAATPNGWVCVWQNGDDVKLRVLGADGTPAGAEVVVNESTAGLQDHPSVAALADGRFAIAFADHAAAGGADIVMQRYTASGAKITGDQSSRVNDAVTAGDQVLPRVASVTASAGASTATLAYGIVWLDQPSSNVQGRFADGSSGYLANGVDGQLGEFQASLSSGHVRSNPVIVSGGSAASVIVGWEDMSTATPGIIARLFPAPPAN